MTLNEITVVRNDYVFWGRRNFFGLENNIVIDTYDQIQTDIESYFERPERAAATVFFRYNFEIVSFDPSVVQTYGGFPRRYKFGNYTHTNSDVHFKNEFITYEKQQSTTGRTFIVDGEQTPLSVFGDETIVPLENSWILLLSETFSNPNIPVSTQFWIELNNTVACNISLLYGGQLTRYFDEDFFPLQTYVNI